MDTRFVLDSTNPSPLFGAIIKTHADSSFTGTEWSATNQVFP